MLVRVRAATLDDGPEVVRMARDLTSYEKLPLSTFSIEQYRQYGFGEKAIFNTLVAEKDGAICGYTMWYRGFTTDDGTPGMHLLDLYVDESARGTGAGKLLMEALAQECTRHDLCWMSWYIVKNNQAAGRFYDSLGFRATSRISYHADQESLRAFLEKQKAKL